MILSPPQMHKAPPIRWQKKALMTVVETGEMQSYGKATPHTGDPPDKAATAELVQHKALPDKAAPAELVQREALPDKTVPEAPCKAVPAKATYVLYKAAPAELGPPPKQPTRRSPPILTVKAVPKHKMSATPKHVTCFAAGIPSGRITEFPEAV
jgi:hypothetical protein